MSDTKSVIKSYPPAERVGFHFRAIALEYYAECHALMRRSDSLSDCYLLSLKGSSG